MWSVEFYLSLTHKNVDTIPRVDLVCSGNKQSGLQQTSQIRTNFFFRSECSFSVDRVLLARLSLGVLRSKRSSISDFSVGYFEEPTNEQANSDYTTLSTFDPAAYRWNYCRGAKPVSYT